MVSGRRRTDPPTVTSTSHMRTTDPLVKVLHTNPLSPSTPTSTLRSSQSGLRRIWTVGLDRRQTPRVPGRSRWSGGRGRVRTNLRRQTPRPLRRGSGCRRVSTFDSTARVRHPSVSNPNPPPLSLCLLSYSRLGSTFRFPSFLPGAGRPSDPEGMG